MGVLVIIGTILVFLRFTDYIDWEWWVVCLPFIVVGVINLMTIIIGGMEGE